MVSSSPTQVAHLTGMQPQEKGIDNLDVSGRSHFQLRNDHEGFSEANSAAASQDMIPPLANSVKFEENNSEGSTGDSDEVALSTPQSDSDNTRPSKSIYPQMQSQSQELGTNRPDSEKISDISNISDYQLNSDADRKAQTDNAAEPAAKEAASANNNTANDNKNKSPHHLSATITPNQTKHTPRTHRPSTATSKRAAAVAAAGLDNEVLVGTRVSEGHGNFVTAYNMLTGIRVAVSRCTAKVNRSLTSADFTATEEISFDMSGGGHSPSSKYMFQFKDYSPWVFRHLRDAFKLDPADYLMSLTAKYIVSELGSPGKSGSFFYYSRDYRFIIKTIRHSEHKLLRQILRKYYEHVKGNPDTLISQFYGLHRVRLPFGRKIHFVVMNNVFPALYEIHERYDLKGSLLGREYTRESSKPIVVYKDLDWLRNHRRIVLGPEKRERIIRQLEKDTAFLKAVNVMDYSLLIGIHDMSKGNSALNSLFNLDQFGPVDKNNSGSSKHRRIASSGDLRHNDTQREFSELQTLLMKATPEKLKEFDFADEYRSEFYFYRDHGGFQSTDDNNENLDVIYYVGVIDFLTGYTFRKSVETFCKSLVHDRKELSAVPAGEYGDRFLKFLRGCIGPDIKSQKPHKRPTDESKASGSTLDKKQNKTEDTSKTNDKQGGSGNAQLQNSAPPNISVTTSSTPNRGPASPINAVTVDDDQKFETIVRAASPLMDLQSRRPSVVGYGQDIPKVV